MRITYNAPNRAHHYPLAKELNNQGCLHAFVSGFSRLSPRSRLPELGDKLVRRDFVQNIYLAAGKLKLPSSLLESIGNLSLFSLDRASFRFAVESDVFLFYRTAGIRSTRRLKKCGSSTLCVLEEVNSHVRSCYQLMNEEHMRLGLGTLKDPFADTQLREEAYNDVDRILVPSEFVRRSFLDRGFLPEKILKVPFGFSPSTSPKSEIDIDKTNPKFRILFVGQLHFRKGLRYLVEAFRDLSHSNKELVLVGPKTKVTGLESTPIPENVRFTGALKGSELQNEFLKASVFVLPTLEEGMALVQGEALSYGLPLITTWNSGGDDLITDGKEGFIVNAFDSIAIRDSLQSLADDKSLLESMRNAACLRFPELGGWTASASLLIEKLRLCMAVPT